jgi:hypothetical protein
MANLSRHNISRAQSIFQGSAANGVYQGGKDGIQASQSYVYKPAGVAAVTFTAALAAGVSVATLTANWGPPTGLYPLTLSTGQIVNAFLTQGGTAVSFYQPLPLSGTTLNAATTQQATTTAATVAGVPPVGGVAAAYAASQSIAAAGSAVLNGATYAGITLTVKGTQYTGAAPDVPRNVVGAWTTSSTVMVSGFDLYNQPMTETQTGTTFTGKKAFAFITSITSSAAITGATFGFGNVLGLPFVVTSGNFLGAVFNDSTETTGTFVQADLTYPATTSTGDTRGTYAPAGTLNGAKWLNLDLQVLDVGSQIGAFGQQPA